MVDVSDWLRTALASNGLFLGTLLQGLALTRLRYHAKPVCGFGLLAASFGLSNS